ncbi:MAG: SGNH/GDSL hydrolase family protein, partial [Phycisphaerae bacterium]|nr:SGNH/GDSL hydrolase family protein [Phycisphaerae bacterium]
MRFWLILVSAVVAGLSTTVAGAPPMVNLREAFADTKARLRRGQTANVLVLGDSLSFNPGSYLPVFRQRLQQVYGNAGYGYQGLSLWTGGAFNQGWTHSGLNSDYPPHHSLDGLWNEYDGESAWPNSADVYPHDRTVQIHYLKGPERGSFDIRLGTSGPVVATIRTDSADFGVGTFSLTLPAVPTGQAAFSYHPHRNGPVAILGHVSQSDQPGIRIHRAANGGWGVKNFLWRNSTFDQQLGLLDPDLVMIWLGQNDQSETRTSYAMRIGQLVDRLRAGAPSSEIVLVGTYNQGSAALPELVEGMFDVATQRGLGFINLYRVAGTPRFFELNGLLSDGIHFTPAGGSYFGNLLAEAFLTDGRSLIGRDFI